MTNAEDSHDTNPALGTEIKSPSALAASQPDDLHDLFAAPADDAEDPLAGLRNDPNYSELIRELEYIAREARELFKMSEDPSESVWDNIQKELKKGESE